MGVNLEGLRDLDVLQVAKVARKREVEIELDTALGLAKARVRRELRGRRAAQESSFSFDRAVARPMRPVQNTSARSAHRAEPFASLGMSPSHRAQARTGSQSVQHHRPESRAK